MNWTEPGTDSSLGNHTDAVTRFTRPAALILGVFTAILLIPDLTPGGRLGAWITGVLALLLELTHQLERKGYVDLARQVGVGVFAMTAMAATAMFGGITGATTAGLVLIVVVGGALGGWNGVRWATAGALCAATVLWVVEGFGFTPIELTHLSPVGGWLTTITCIGLAAAGLRLFALAVAESESAAEFAQRRAVAIENQLAELVDNSPDGIALLTPDGVIILVNPAMAALVGASRESMQGTGLGEATAITGADGLHKLAHAYKQLKRGSHPLFELEMTTRDGERVPVEVHARTVHTPSGAPRIQVMVRDLRERREAAASRKALERRLEVAQRLESLGRLAGGVAHDFRNLLMVIQGSTELILDREVEADSQADLERVVEATDKASELTQRLLAFAQRHEVSTEVLQPNDAVRSVSRLMSRLVRDDIRVELDLHSKARFVLADAGQLENILVNLVTNATDAMPEGGTVTVATRPVELAEGDIEGMKAGLYSEISVTDEGTGMDAETIRRAFEPFFTTKEVGRGTGLGLAMAHGLVTAAGGTVLIHSEVGVGTKLRILMPAVNAPQPKRPPPTPEPPPPRAQASILLVDDQQLVRETGRRMLETGGYTVLEAANGSEAVNIAGTGVPVDLVVTDVVMPGMSGVDVYYAICHELQTPVVFVSGYSDAELRGELPMGPRISMLRKPFRTREFLRVVARLLAQRDSTLQQ